MKQAMHTPKQMRFLCGMRKINAKMHACKNNYNKSYNNYNRSYNRCTPVQLASLHWIHSTDTRHTFRHHWKAKLMKKRPRLTITLPLLPSSVWYIYKYSPLPCFFYPSLDVSLHSSSHLSPFISTIFRVWTTFYINLNKLLWLPDESLWLYSLCFTMSKYSLLVYDSVCCTNFILSGGPLARFTSCPN